MQLNPFRGERNFARIVTFRVEEGLGRSREGVGEGAVQAQGNTKSNRKTIALKRFRRTFATDREALAISGPITRYALAILSAATGARRLRPLF